MKKLLAVSFLASLILSACQPANITAVKWDTGEKGAGIQTRCERVDMRDQGEMQTAFSKYDGWKLIYISEYTTGNKSGTDAAVCFEKVK